MRVLYLILYILLVLQGCTKGDCTGKTTISYSTIEDFGGVGCGLDTSGFATSNMNYIVLDELTMQSLLACDELPGINFDDYTLLIGSYRSDTDLSYRDQAIIRDCEAGLVTYQISFESEGLDTIMLVHYHAVIPRVPDGYITDFTIKVWQVQ
jgi:hypothetical protein